MLEWVSENFISKLRKAFAMSGRTLALVLLLVLSSLPTVAADNYSETSDPLEPPGITEACRISAVAVASVLLVLAIRICLIIKVSPSLEGAKNGVGLAELEDMEEKRIFCKFTILSFS